MTAVVTASLHDRIVDAAITRTTEHGWASVTMSALASDVGVSRQTVYNEVGAKPALAEAMVLAELGRFLEVVRAAFAAHPHDLDRAIRGAVHDVLAFADGNALVRAIVAGGHGEDVDLLPPLTTRSWSLQEAARGVLSECLAPYDVDSGHVGAAVDVIVRVVLSHVVQPSGSAGATADDVAWAAARLLR